MTVDVRRGRVGPVPSHTVRALAAGGAARTRSVLLWLLLVLLLAATVAAHVGAAQPLRIVTSSMAPTLVPGEHVLATAVREAAGLQRCAARRLRAARRRGRRAARRVRLRSSGAPSVPAGGR